MTDRPIIFSPAMVRALLAGTKTQTRRLGTSPLRHCAVGDRLYVREHWRTDQHWDDTAPRDITPGQRVSYLADGPDGQMSGKDRRGMHMPRWASRLTLQVTRVVHDRLHSIKDADAVAEGVERVDYDGENPAYFSQFGWKDYRDHPHAAAPFRSPRTSFETLWNSLHDEPGTRWSDNPMIVAVHFRVIPGNIDTLT